MHDLADGRPDAAAASPQECAAGLLDAVRVGDDAGPYRDRLASFDDDALEPVRTDRAAALAFWSNLYNAGTQLLLDRCPERYDSRLRTVRFFRATAVRVAGTDLSLDDVEHGVLRGSRSKYGLGYLPRLASGRFVRRHSLSSPDPRVHFALNCGAASCPAVRVYHPDRVDDQLDRATANYLGSTVEYDPDAAVATVPRLFRWYRGDFGGPSGIRSLLRAYDLVPADASPRLSYRSWDWSPAPGKFAGDEADSDGPSRGDDG